METQSSVTKANHVISNNLKVQTSIPVEDKVRKLKFGNENLFYLTENGQVGSVNLKTFEIKPIIRDGNISDQGSTHQSQSVLGMVRGLPVGGV